MKRFAKTTIPAFLSLARSAGLKASIVEMLVGVFLLL
jgi:hypothetical protein